MDCVVAAICQHQRAHQRLSWELLPAREGVEARGSHLPLIVCHSHGHSLGYVSGGGGCGGALDLASVGLRHRVLLYADDMVIFAELDVREIYAV
jgi:hypothetical protein